LKFKDEREKERTFGQTQTREIEMRPGETD
jgi:hypothetical protein